MKLQTFLTRFSKIKKSAQTITSVWNSYIFQGLFNQTFTEALLSSALVQIVNVLRFEHFWLNYSPM